MKAKQAMEMAIKALSETKGDDLNRARAAFRGMSEEELKWQHGESGMTRAEVLAGYKRHEDEVDMALVMCREVQSSREGLLRELWRVVSWFEQFLEAQRKGGNLVELLKHVDLGDAKAAIDRAMLSA